MLAPNLEVWRYLVMEKDNHTCQVCGEPADVCHHIKDYEEYPKLRLETDNGEPPQIRACLRGRAYRQRIYHPDRLKYPLRRVGERGEGKFEQVT